MIIKSKSWKSNNKNNSAQFNRLFKYLEHDNLDSFAIFHNFKSKNDISKAIKELYHNDQYRKRRKGGVAFYHEILSLSKKDEQHINSEMLHSIAHEYLKLRCSNGLAYCKAHLHHSKQPHLHFLISANEIASDKTMRISKALFKSIKLDMAAFEKDRFPNLVHSEVSHDKKNSRTKHQDIEAQTKKRTKTALEKEKISVIVKQALGRASTLTELKSSLRKDNIELYHYRNKPSGVLFNNKKYRFSTLNIDKNSFKFLLDYKYPNHIKQRIEELNETRNLNKSQNKDREIEL